MALDPPMEVVQFLQFVGIDWLMINVRRASAVVRAEVRDLRC